jgi:hypothetical protein
LVLQCIDLSIWICRLGVNEFRQKNSKVNIKNIGGLPMPIMLKLTYQDDKEQFIERTVMRWSEGNSSVAIDIDNIKNLKSIQLITTHYPDSDKTNNDLEIKE